MTPAAPSNKLPMVCLAPAALEVVEAAAPVAEEAADDAVPEPEVVPFGEAPPTKLADTPVLFVQWEL